MNFKVIGEWVSIGSVSPSHHEMADEALAKAVELMIRGLADVHIVNAAGRHFTPSEFAQEMDGSSTDASRDGQKNECTAYRRIS